MAIGDYILCCKCEVKLIYDGDRDQREWWEERFGKEPEIECPNCKPQRKPLTHGEIYTAYITATNQTLRATDERLAFAFARAIEAAHGIKENT